LPIAVITPCGRVAFWLFGFNREQAGGAAAGGAGRHPGFWPLAGTGGEKAAESTGPVGSAKRKLARAGQSGPI